MFSLIVVIQGITCQGITFAGHDIYDLIYPRFLSIDIYNKLGSRASAVYW